MVSRTFVAWLIQVIASSTATFSIAALGAWVEFLDALWICWALEWETVDFAILIGNVSRQAGALLWLTVSMSATLRVTTARIAEFFGITRHLLLFGRLRLWIEVVPLLNTTLSCGIEFAYYRVTDSEVRVSGLYFYYYSIIIWYKYTYNCDRIRKCHCWDIERTDQTVECSHLHKAYICTCHNCVQAWARSHTCTRTLLWHTTDPCQCTQYEQNNSD